MRKLAPMFIMASIVAFAGGNALATTTTTAVDKTKTTDKLGTPTVSANTNDSQNLSYSDKSNTSPGTNAKIGDKPMAMWNGTSTDCSAITAMDHSKLSAKMKQEHAKAKMDCAAALKMAATPSTMSTTSPASPAAGSNSGSAVNSTTGISPGK